MARRLPLSTLLSFALVAFTIEFDNELEHRLPHRTSDFGGDTTGPWLVSLAMYLNCLQFVPEEGIGMRALEQEARTQPNWDGMRRWGYVFFQPDPKDPRPRPPQPAWLVRATAQGRLAQKTMRELLPEIEQRWSARFGAAVLRDLRVSLIGMLRTLPGGLPDCMPILRYGLTSEGPKERATPSMESAMATLPLPILLARVLLGLTLEFERESPVSLAICANIVRVLQAEGTLVRRIPALSGVSKESIAMGLGFLEKRGCVQVLSQEPARRGRIVQLTAAGSELQAEYPRRLRLVEERWRSRTGPETTATLRAALEAVGGDGTREGSPLFAGLEPYPEGWRAKAAAARTLPHFPMVLHRGGFPDGS